MGVKEAFWAPYVCQMGVQVGDRWSPSVLQIGLTKRLQFQRTSLERQDNCQVPQNCLPTVLFVAGWRQYATLVYIYIYGILAGGAPAPPGPPRAPLTSLASYDLSEGDREEERERERETEREREGEMEGGWGGPPKK